MFPAKLKTKVVMVCIDDSPHTERAFEWYINNIHEPTDEVGLIHVHVQPEAPSLSFFGGGMAALEAYKIELEESIQRSRRVVNKYRDKCVARMIPSKLHAHTMETSVGYTVLKIAKEHNATQIILGSRGLGTIRRTVLGSVSDYIMHHSDVPVTIVPPPERCL